MIRLLILTAGLVGFLTLAGCAHHHHERGHAAPVARKGGPPPHAPAHGYRHKHHHHGVELIFDTHLGVYAVVGLDDHFFHDELFYRLTDGVWYRSVRLDGKWLAVNRSLPPGLAKKHHKHHHKKRKGHPAKHKR